MENREFLLLKGIRAGDSSGLVFFTINTNHYCLYDGFRTCMYYNVNYVALNVPD